MGYLIGADIGSQSVKAVLLDPDGQIAGTAGHGYAMSHPASGWAEQDPADWTAGLTAAVRRLLAEHGVAAGQVSHLGLASQVDGVAPVDAKLRPLRPAIIWLDRRASDQAAALAAAAGTDEIFARTGLNADASHIAPKLMWLRDHEPEVWAQARSLPAGRRLRARLADRRARPGSRQRVVHPAVRRAHRRLGPGAAGRGRA